MDNSPASRISVVIPCHDGVDDTRDCLMALREQGPSADIRERLEIVVVDNGSTDGTRWLDREFPEIRLERCEQNLGFAGGVNRGIEIATGDLLLVLNNDTMPAPQMIARLEAALLSDPRIAVAGATSNQVKGSARVDVGDLGRTHGGRVGIEAVLNESCGDAPIEDVETLSGLCMMMRRATAQEFEGFDTRFGPGMFEDDDFCLRIRLTGRRLVVVRNAFVHHRGHRTFQRLGDDLGETMQRRQRVFADKWRDSAVGRTYLARIIGDEETSADAALAALDAYPDWPDGRIPLARDAYRRRDYSALLEHTERFLASSPRHGSMAVFHAVALLGTSRRDEGAEAFGTTLEKCYFSPEGLAEALAIYGRFFLEAGDAEAAHPHLQNSYELVPENLDYVNAFGAARIELGQFEAALELFENAPVEGDAHTHNLIGVCAWKLGNPTRAIREFERAIAGRPDDASFHENLAKVEQALHQAR